MSNELTPADALIDAALSRVKDGDCVVVVEDISQAEVRFANNRPTTNGVRRVRNVQVTRFVDVDGGVSAGSARAAGDVDIDALFDAATNDAQSASGATDAFSLVEGTKNDEPDPNVATTSLAAFKDVLHELGDGLARAEKEDRILAGFMEHTMATTTLASSRGLYRRHLQPTGALQLVGSTPKRTATSWAGLGAPHFSRGAFSELDAQVRQGLQWAKRRIEVKPGRQRVILSPSAVGDLMVGLAESMSRREAQEGRTAFSAPGQKSIEGKSLSSLPFTLASDPMTEELRCRPFLVTGASSASVSIFDLGLPLERTAWITKGVVSSLLTPRADAARENVAPHAPIDNLSLVAEGATASLSDLIRSSERALLVTCLWYIRVVDEKTMLLTGLTRDGVYVIEDGEVVGSSTNFRFNESPLDLLGRAEVAGRSVRTLGREFGEWMNRTTMPPLVISDFNMSSVSQGV